MGTLQKDGASIAAHQLSKPADKLPCPRCGCSDTKFCYFNNYNIKQPRYFCRGCLRYWTAGGSQRNVPIGSGRRRNRSSFSREQPDQPMATANEQTILCTAHGSMSMHMPNSASSIPTSSQSKLSHHSQPAYSPNNLHAAAAMHGSKPMPTSSFPYLSQADVSHHSQLAGALGSLSIPTAGLPFTPPSQHAHHRKQPTTPVEDPAPDERTFIHQSSEETKLSSMHISQKEPTELKASPRSSSLPPLVPVAFPCPSSAQQLAAVPWIYPWPCFAWQPPYISPSSSTSAAASSSSACISASSPNTASLPQAPPNFPAVFAAPIPSLMPTMFAPPASSAPMTTGAPSLLPAVFPAPPVWSPYFVGHQLEEQQPLKKPLTSQGTCTPSSASSMSFHEPLRSEHRSAKTEELLKVEPK